MEDLTQSLNQLATDGSLHSKVGNMSLSEEQLVTFTGLDWEKLTKVEQMLTSMRDRESRIIKQALAVFLFKLKSGSSNTMIRSIFTLRDRQQVCECFHQVIDAFETDVLLHYFGINARSREDLIANEASYIAKKLLKTKDS